MKITPLQLDSSEAARRLFDRLGVSSQGTQILAPKSIFYSFQISDIRSWEANILKQELLSLGADAALNRNVLIKKCRTTIVIFATLAQLQKLVLKLKGQPFDLRIIGIELQKQLDGLQDKRFWVVGKTKFDFSRPVICGILNVTPDSFSGDGLLSDKSYVAAVVKQAETMLKSGADILDIGGESTRPFSKPVGHKEEIRRVVPAVKAIRKAFPNVLISVDTYRFLTARACVDCGIDIINDISALRYDKNMAKLVAKEKLGLVLMHMHKDPARMQINPRYKDLMLSLIDFFRERLEYCADCGIERGRIAIDPGIGFGKTVTDNLVIIKNLKNFKIFGRPVFVGLSRKSFIAKTLNIEENRLIGTVAANICAFAGGANIFRVHDVAAAREALDMAQAIKAIDVN